MLSSCIYSGILKYCFPSWFNARTLTTELLKRMFLISVLFSINIVLANYSLRYCSLALDQMVRCTVPVWTTILQYFITGERISRNQSISLLLIVIGSVMVCYGDIWITVIGLCFLIISVLASTLKGIFTKIILSGENSNQLSPLQTLFINSEFGILELLTVSFIIDIQFYTHYIFSTSPSILILLAFHGFIAFLVNISNFNAMKQSSPLIMNIVANIRQIFMVLFSVFVFKQPLTLMGCVGSIITICGSIWYFYEKSKDKEKNYMIEDEEVASEKQALI